MKLLQLLLLLLQPVSPEGGPPASRLDKVTRQYSHQNLQETQQKQRRNQNQNEMGGHGIGGANLEVLRAGIGSINGALWGWNRAEDSASAILFPFYQPSTKLPSPMAAGFSPNTPKIRSYNPRSGQNRSYMGGKGSIVKNLREMRLILSKNYPSCSSRDCAFLTHLSIGQPWNTQSDGGRGELSLRISLTFLLLQLSP